MVEINGGMDFSELIVIVLIIVSLGTLIIGFGENLNTAKPIRQLVYLLSALAIPVIMWGGLWTIQSIYIKRKIENEKL